MDKNKKGVAPIIATVLLVAVVVIFSLIIFMWARGFVKEAVQKNGMPADQACGEIDLEVAYIGNELQITNRGNIPVYSVELLKKEGGNIDRATYSSNVRFTPGKSDTKNVGEYDEIEVIPQILGEAEAGGSKKIYTCKTGFTAASV